VNKKCTDTEQKLEKIRVENEFALKNKDGKISKIFFLKRQIKIYFLLKFHYSGQI